MATFYVQLEDRLLQISGELTADNISNALGYTPSSFSGEFEDLQNNPIIKSSQKDINIVDEDGNIIAVINNLGIQSSDFVADVHKLSEKANLTDIPNSVSQLTNDSEYISGDVIDDIIDEINGTSTSNSSKASILYVNASTGSDSNKGTKNSPKKTFASAIQDGGDVITIIFEGDTTERLNLKQKSSLSKLVVIGAGGKRNRIISGTKLTSFTQYSSGIYQIGITHTNLSNTNYNIYQHDVNDTNTLISDSEKHASQKGRKYRKQSKKLDRVSSLSALSSASNYSFYYDNSNKKLYVKTANTNFNTNPIMLPTDVGGIYGNDGTCQVELYNVEVWYAPLIANQCNGGLLVDCSAKFALGTGGIRYDDSLGIRFIRCEACATNNLSGYGDGINGHSYLDNNLNANSNRHLYVSAEMIDCWCHDNDDDGWSDHTGCKSILRGGLYEYNKKGGVTPSGGVSCECYNVLSRKNYRGFYYISSTLTTKEPDGEFYVQNCVSMNNSIAGFDTLSNGSSLKVYCQLIDCKSIDDKVGFKAGSYCIMKLIDCSVLNAQTIKECDSTATQTIITTTKLNS